MHGVDDIIEELSWRGLIADSTNLDELRLALKSSRITVYCGFDPTAPMRVSRPHRSGSGAGRERPLVR